MLQIIAGFVVSSITLFLLGVQYGMQLQSSKDNEELYFYCVMERANDESS